MLERSTWDSVVWGWSSYSQTKKENPAENVGDGITVGRGRLEAIPGYSDPGKESQCPSMSPGRILWASAWWRSQVLSSQKDLASREDKSRQ